MLTSTEKGQNSSNVSSNVENKDDSILVTAVSGVGNLLLFTPALRLLSHQRTRARTDVLTEGRPSCEIANHLPEVDEVFDLGYEESMCSALQLMGSLRFRRYDQNITAFPSNKWQFHILAAGVGAKERIAHSYPECDGIKLESLQTRLVPAVRGLHDIEQNLRLVGGRKTRSREDGSPPRPHPCVTEEAEEWAVQYVASREMDSPIVAIHPGSARTGGQLAKRWPAARFVPLISGLLDFGATVIVFCGPDEQEIENYLRAQATEQAWADVYFPEGSILQIAALIERCDVMVSNDSGLMHVAEAQETPVVALFGPTDASRTAPPWEDCRVLRATDAARLDYPFSTKCSRLRPVSDDFWENLSAERVLTTIQSVTSTHV